MTKVCQLTLHYHGEKDELDSETYKLSFADEKEGTVLSSSATRESTQDAVKFAEIVGWLHQQLAINKTVSLDDHIQVLQYLRYSFAYRAYHFFNAEYAEVVRLKLIEESGVPGYEPSLEDIFAIMKKEGLFPHKEESEMEALKKELEEQLKSRYGASYDTKYFTAPLFQPYFAKLNVSEGNNALAPEDYLLRNFNKTKDEPLLHVRECEDIGCSMNPRKSPFIRLISDAARKKIVQMVMEKPEINRELMVYAGFACGNLRRDLDILTELIDGANVKNLELIFIDRAYATFIQSVVDCENPTMEEYVDAALMSKAVKEFAGWIANQLGCQEDNPLVMHLFSNVKDAQAYLNKAGKKITLLVGQDYFTDDGCYSKRYATPGAHDDFMEFAKDRLHKKGSFFELIKQDTKDELYFHEGMIREEKEYVPVSCKQWNLKSKESRVYAKTSLAFFVPNNDAPVACEKGKEYLSRQYDEGGELVSMRYSH